MPACRLYPVLASGDDFTGRIAQLQKLAGEADIAAILLPEACVQAPGIGPFITAAQGLGIAVLIENDVAACRRLKADGVEVDGLAAFSAARAELGRDAMIGARAGASRHAAMSLGEAGADYVAMDAGLIEWWAAMFEPACVCATPLTPADAGPVIAAGADFIRPADLADAPALSRLIAGMKS